MNKLLLLLLSVATISCSQFNKGVIAKKELRKNKPPSVRIAEDYDKRGKTKVYSNPKKAAKMREKQNARLKKRGDKYLKRRRRNRD